MKTFELARQNIEKGIAPRILSHKEGYKLLCNSETGKWAIIHEEDADELSDLYMSKTRGSDWKEKDQMLFDSCK